VLVECSRARGQDQADILVAHGAQEQVGLRKELIRGTWRNFKADSIKDSMQDGYTG